MTLTFVQVARWSSGDDRDEPILLRADLRWRYDGCPDDEDRIRACGHRHHEPSAVLLQRRFLAERWPLNQPFLPELGDGADHALEVGESHTVALEVGVCSAVDGIVA